MNMKRQKDMILKDEPPRLVGAQYATGDQWKNNSRNNEKMEPKQKQQPVVVQLQGILKARILKWFASPFSSEPHFVRTLYHDPSILGGPKWHSCLIELDKAVVRVIRLISFL